MVTLRWIGREWEGKGREGVEIEIAVAVGEPERREYAKRYSVSL